MHKNEFYYIDFRLNFTRTEECYENTGVSIVAFLFVFGLFYWHINDIKFTIYPFLSILKCTIKWVLAYSKYKIITI